MADHKPIYGSYLLFLLFSLNSLYFVDTEGLPKKAQLENLVENLSRTLVGRFNTVTASDTVVAAYNNTDSKNKAHAKFSLKFEKLDTDAIVKNFADSLRSMFLLKMEALNNSVRAAEEAAANHTWNNNIKKEDFTCLKAKEILPNNTGLVYSERFKQKIIPNVSSIHIPVEIYDGVKLVPQWSLKEKIPRDVEILNGLQWSAALDKVFTENYKKDPEILWQYFGSQSGFMRTLPASRWETGDEVDLYDVRRRPWYTQGSSSPKDMLILIDTSGSVFGQALELIKVAVKSLLDTLGENDFVNIAHFSKEAHNVSRCFNGTFVQANYRNKKKLIEEVNGIEAGGMANYKAGLTFAFEQFVKLKNQTNGRRGADCNRMIMLLTDGGSDLAEDVFKKYNPKDHQMYRVFTYAVGPTANPVSAIRWMACANKGYFSQIPAMGAVRSKVQDYMKAQVEALAKYNLKFEERVQFSIKHDIRGLGMMTTVTLPVYNKTNMNGSTAQTILGVMGIDVTTDAMLKYAPLRKFGPNGFTFAINANGYIVFHPKLKVQNDLKDPPNVDFLEVEVETDATVQLRNDMIDQKQDRIEIVMYTIAKDQRHVDIENGDRKRIISYRGIDLTNFSLGVNIPKYHEYYLMIETDIQTPVNEKNKSLLNDTHTALLIPDWEFFEGYLSKNSTGTVLDLQEALENPSQYKWDDELINHLLFDLSVTSTIDGFWPLLHNNPDGEGLIGAFIATMGGLTKIYPKSCTYKHLATRNLCEGPRPRDRKCYIECSNVTDREDLVKQFIDQRDPWKANYFKRAIDAPHLIFSAPYILDPVSPENISANDSFGEVTVVKSISINNSKMGSNLGGQSLNYKAAVLGAVFTHEHIRDTMIKVSNQTSIGDCGDPSTTACYLIDDGAFLIATNQEQYETSVGRFFGKVDPEVMFQLYNSSFFHRIHQFDYTATCNIVNDETSAANINIPFVALFYEFLTFNWWSSIMTWTITNFNIYNMMYTEPAYGLEDELFNMAKTRECVKKQAQYFFSDLEYLEGQTDCEVRNINCSREFVVHRVMDTNLVMVITDAEKDGCDKCRKSVNPKDLIQEPIEPSAREVDNEFCHMKPRYRKSTSNCYDSHPAENTDKCSASLAHPVSMVIIFLVSMAIILLNNR
ncbi:voltage-dependent calcium channel subunit alpha-2/delta-2-like isoform X2 [Ruditapes philippinarum]|uniref:voltage-dependent calcium channel subunit alpha-2/delta-2-like isoform X2 n=1 Tax=Ruditapes philippinarum TaxID=129788 RepID=UPI00295BBB0F|nr:voltage-dependent calcium channel subunit alpha-2/delta-2-like isoform X2 [Ruditapes philippinarum]